MASRDYDGPYRQGDIMALLPAIAELRRQRGERGLGLTDAPQRSGLDRGMLSRLEDRKILNPTVATLWHCAEGIGAQVSSVVNRLESRRGLESRGVRPLLATSSTAP
jgi:transcriptional regulator with XRE-family HTH domain